MNRKELAEQKRCYPGVCDIYEQDGNVVCRIEMPGVKKDGLDIRVEEDQLIINGKKAVKPVKGEFLIHEIRECDYHHEFTIDDTVDRNKIDASIKDGVVTLVLGIKEAQKPRKIEIVAK